MTKVDKYIQFFISEEIKQRALMPEHFYAGYHEIQEALTAAKAASQRPDTWREHTLLIDVAAKCLAQLGCQAAFNGHWADKAQEGCSDDSGHSEVEPISLGHLEPAPERMYRLGYTPETEECQAIFTFEKLDDRGQWVDADPEDKEDRRVMKGTAEKLLAWNDHLDSKGLPSSVQEVSGEQP